MLCCNFKVPLGLLLELHSKPTIPIAFDVAVLAINVVGLEHLIELAS